MTGVHRLRFLLALIAGLFLLAGSILAAPLPAAAGAAADTAPSSSTDGAGDESTDQESPTEVSITLDEVTPWIGEKDTLTVKGLVTNSGDDPVEAPTLSLLMSTRKLDTESRIESWTTDPNPARTIASVAEDGPSARKKAAKAAKKSGEKQGPVTKADAKLGKTLAPGTSQAFSFSVPAKNLQLPSRSPVTNWGPRGLMVQMGDAQGPRATRVGFTTWHPDPKFDKTSISLLAPVTLPGYSADGLISAEDLDAAIAPSGSLSAIESLLDEPSVALAIDPRIIASFHEAIETGAKNSSPAPSDASSDASGSADGADTAGTGKDGATAPAGQDSEASTSAEGDDSAATDAGGAQTPTTEDDARADRLRTWYDGFIHRAKRHTVIALPYADPSQAVLTDSTLNDMGRFADFQKELVSDAVPDAITDLQWPLAGTADREQLATLESEGAKTVILDDEQQPSITGVRDDARSTTRLDAGGRKTIDTLISDTTLTDLVARTIASDRPAADISELVATTAAVQAEAPYRSRHLLVPLPRTAASASWSETVGAIADAPWVQGEDLRDLLSSNPSPRGFLQPGTDPSRIPTSTLTGLASLRTEQDTFNTAFTDSATMDSRADRMLLTCTSAAWTTGGSAPGCLNRAQDDAKTHRESIHLEKGSTVLLVTGEKTTIPVTIVNDAPAEATLQVRMTPATPQLRAKTTEVVRVPPGETMRVDVPVEGIANADVETTIEMLTSRDVVLPQTSTLLVRVRADWENIGTAVVGALLAAVFVIGLIKSISRGRRKIPEQQLADAVARATSAEPEMPDKEKK